MTRYAEKTAVPSEQSRAEIERTLARYGSSAFSYGWESTRAVIQFRAQGRFVRFELPLPAADDPVFTSYTVGTKNRATYLRSASAAREKHDQAVRQRWRALALCIKAKLEAVESGISDFESEFLANIVLPGGTTAGAWLRPHIGTAYESGKMPDSFPAIGTGS